MTLASSISQWKTNAQERGKNRKLIPHWQCHPLRHIELLPWWSFLHQIHLWREIRKVYFIGYFWENKSKGSAVATMGNGNSISFFFKANKRTCIYIYIYGIISQDVPLIPSQKSYTSILQIHKTEFGSSWILQNTQKASSTTESYY